MEVEGLVALWFAVRVAATARPHGSSSMSISIMIVACRRGRLFTCMNIGQCRVLISEGSARFRWVCLRLRGTELRHGLGVVGALMYAALSSSLRGTLNGTEAAGAATALTGPRSTLGR
ncbi:hypothetical protein C8Q72DRAFT_574790 [Fomitopsis betulina]|nr:hypothetical protein C8Q72DRAFT_574790 [Fomitopsis betulina]